MMYLVATVLLNVLITVLFKIFPKYNIDSFQAIVVNYVVCVATGSLFIGEFPVSAASFQQPWFPFAVMMALGFISVFNLLSYCTKVDGITTSTIANKLSLVIPVIFSLILYKEHPGIWKIAGIVIAFPAVYLTTRVKEKIEGEQNLLLPVLLFIGSGLLDTLVKFVEHHYLETHGVQAIYTIHVFAIAATAGILILVFRGIKLKKRLVWRNVIAGICLGVPNYFSIYFFIRLLNSRFMQSSALIPVNNMGVLLVSALTAMILFRERASVWRVIGLVLSILSILLISYSDYARI